MRVALPLFWQGDTGGLGCSADGTDAESVVAGDAVGDLSLAGGALSEGADEAADVVARVLTLLVEVELVLADGEASEDAEGVDEGVDALGHDVLLGGCGAWAVPLPLVQVWHSCWSGASFKLKSLDEFKCGRWWGLHACRPAVVPLAGRHGKVQGGLVQLREVGAVVSGALGDAVPGGGGLLLGYLSASDALLESLVVGLHEREVGVGVRVERTGAEVARVPEPGEVMSVAAGYLLHDLDTHAVDEVGDCLDEGHGVLLML
jgi:hypothetical protein